MPFIPVMLCHASMQGYLVTDSVSSTLPCPIISVMICASLQEHLRCLPETCIAHDLYSTSDSTPACHAK
jgi:hypothetical protein